MAYNLGLRLMSGALSCQHDDENFHAKAGAPWPHCRIFVRASKVDATCTVRCTGPIKVQHNSHTPDAFIRTAFCSDSKKHEAQVEHSTFTQVRVAPNQKVSTLQAVTQNADTQTWHRPALI